MHVYQEDLVHQEQQNWVLETSNVLLLLWRHIYANIDMQVV